MRHHCNNCNSKLTIKDEQRTNLRCNDCGGMNIILSADVILKCDLCRPCRMPNLQHRRIAADKVFSAANPCFYSSAQGQNATYVVSALVKVPTKKVEPPIKPPDDPAVEVKRKYTKKKA